MARLEFIRQIEEQLSSDKSEDKFYKFLDYDVKTLSNDDIKKLYQRYHNYTTLLKKDIGEERTKHLSDFCEWYLDNVKEERAKRMKSIKLQKKKTFIEAFEGFLKDC